MGIHKNHASKSIKSPVTIPPPSMLPNNIGKRRMIPTIWGTKRHFVIEDEILRKQSNAPHKLIAFQRMRHEEENRIEYRFGYYMVGVKDGAKGRWVWGQYCLLIPAEDLESLIHEAKRRKWF